MTVKNSSELSEIINQAAIPGLQRISSTLPAATAKGLHSQEYEAVELFSMKSELQGCMDSGSKKWLMK